MICKILEEETNSEQFVSNEINNVLLTDQIFGTCFQCAPDNSSLNLYLRTILFIRYINKQQTIYQDLGSLYQQSHMYRRIKLLSIILQYTLYIYI